MNRLLVCALLLLSTQAFCQENTKAPATPPAPDYPALLKEMQSLQQKMNLMQNEITQLKTLTSGTQDPLDKPLLKSEEVIDWVKGSIVEIYSYNFANYKQVLNNIARLFTTPGYESYVKALQDAGNFTIVEQKKSLVNAIVSGEPKITKEGLENNIYSWIVQVPLKVSYQNPDGVVNQDLMANIEVVRINDPKHPDGIAIHSIEAKAPEAVILDVKPDNAKPDVIVAPEAVKPEGVKPQELKPEVNPAPDIKPTNPNPPDIQLPDAGTGKSNLEDELKIPSPN